ncbi:ribosome silencing factor [Chengkuizengella axinellae]|uniref:Ribosomal silencing factor RsfS n=1 Tax=Chengkuizengella axinellae TaxID=3064388 RepID=A0ABT9IUK2_9BACL|nr:ribosome silencing factor [Chengkuizengella sp. 2205SS18-9]MDP5273034.1 ribosome silencing factor [Chengkuizengella sp. 2205SS18-9]
MSLNSEEILTIVNHAIEEKKGNEITSLNIKEISLIADYFVICHGNSEPQVKAIAEEVKKRVEEKNGLIKRMEGYDTARWVLIDIGDVIVHIFHREEREYYNIERLWSDAKVVENA